MKRRSMTILYADDDEDDRLLTADALRDSRVAHRLEVVQDGFELLAYLRRQGQWADPDTSPRPGIILLDLNMPGIDGHKALHAIKADPQLATIPVVVLSTSQAAGDIARSYAMGANSYITKPVTFAGLVQLMADLVRYWFEVVLLPGEAV